MDYFSSISIIVPVYNVENRLALCIQSILSQTDSDFELILVNDGSTDNSLQICKQFEQADSRVTVLDRENSGAGEARNAGLEIAKGKYITFIDSDDTVEPDFLEFLKAGMESSPSIDLVCASNMAESGDGVLAHRAEQMELPADPYVSDDPAECFCIMDKVQAFPYLWNKLFKASIIQENRIRFEKQFVTGEDLDFVVKYYYHVRSCFLSNREIYRYFSSGVGSLCARYKKDLYEIVSELSGRRLGLYQSLNLDGQPEKFQIYENTHIWYLHSCIPNMFRKNANLKFSEKVGLMKKIFRDEKLKKYMKHYVPENSLGRIYKFLFKLRSPFFATAVYSLLFKVRNNHASVYRKLRE